MRNAIKSKYFWLLAVLLASVIFSVGINSGKKYQAEIKILILPKNAVLAGNIDQIIENAKEIPRSLSFYDKLVEFNPDIQNGSFNLPDEKRRSDWNSKIEIKRIDKSGILSISAFSNDQAQAEIVSNQVAKDLATVMGKYYDTRTDLDIRLIDGPIVYLVSGANITNWILASLLAGLFISLIIFSISEIYSTQISKPENLARSPFSLSGLETFNFRRPKTPVETAKKSSAPANLPISEEPTRVKEARPQELSLNEKKYLHREATPEEVKERLNRLLRGNL